MTSHNPDHGAHETGHKAQGGLDALISHLRLLSTDAKHEGGECHEAGADHKQKGKWHDDHGHWVCKLDDHH